MANINQKTVGITFRLMFCLTPNFTIQYYGQPFVSAGIYSKFKKIINPRANRFEDRFYIFTESEITYDSDNNRYNIDDNRDGTIDYKFDNPDFNMKQFRSNLVIRWEYTPGSTLYLVWSQQRSAYNPYGDFNYRSDLRDTFSIYPHNVFLIKFNKWLSL